MNANITHSEIAKETLTQDQPGMPPLPEEWRTWMLRTLHAARVEHHEQLNSMKDAGEMLWIVVANVSNGNWEQQSKDWQEAAARWRDNYHDCCCCSKFNLKTA